MATTTPERSHKLVMGLGIVAILLFSANLITAVVHHFWPEQESGILHFTTDTWEEGDATAEVYTIGRSDYHRKFVIRRRHAAPSVDVQVKVETDLEQELARLERRIEIEALSLENELTLKFEKNEWQAAMESAKEALHQAEKSLAKEKVLREKAARETVQASRDGRNR